MLLLKTRQKWSKSLNDIHQIIIFIQNDTFHHDHKNKNRSIETVCTNLSGTVKFDALVNLQIYMYSWKKEINPFAKMSPSYHYEVFLKQQ